MLELRRRNLITRENILDRFSQNLEWAAEIDIATAWTTPNQSLCALQRREPPPTVRAVVGPLDGTTNPDALRALYCTGRLCIIASESRFFHPKIYIFRGVDRSVAWIGSANFTASGFENNEEVLFETSDTKAVECWFKRLWRGDKCVPLNESAIDRYANWRKSLGQQAPRKIWPPATTNVATVDRMQLLEAVNDWKSYVMALEKCDLWWNWKSRREKYPFSVLGKRHSYLHTISAGREIAHSSDWTNLNRSDSYILRGKDTEEGNWALLGSCRGKAEKIFNPENENLTDIMEIREQIHRYVKQVRFASDINIVHVAHGKLQKIVKDEIGPFKGIGPAAGSRLLTLARPDRLVSVNGASAAKLGQLICGEARTPKWLANHYDKLLKWLHEQPWFKAQEPDDSVERKIWNCRAALLDAFVYQWNDG